MMKTIAITIEEQALRRVDALVRSGRGTPWRNRSDLVRQAVQLLLDDRQRLAREEREHDVMRKHSRMLRRQAAALVREQAKP